MPPLDRLAVTFDDDRAVANAGLLLPATLSQQLGLEQLANDTVSVGARPGRKLATLVHALAVGADCIDDLDVLRAGATQGVLGHRVMAPRRWGAGCGR